MKVKSESEVAESCPTLSDPMDCSLPGSSIHGIFQARVLEWGAIAFSASSSYNLLNTQFVTVDHPCVPFPLVLVATLHSIYIAWKIPWTEEPGGPQSMGSLRVGQDSATSLSLFTFLHWRRQWQPTRVFLPGESQGQGSLVSCRLWGRTESDTTEAT